MPLKARDLRATEPLIIQSQHDLRHFTRAIVNPHSSLTLSEDRTPNGVVITPNDGSIMASSYQQQRGGIHLQRFNCGPFRTPYLVVQRGTMIDADGEKSNTIDFTIKCPGANPP